MKKYFFILAVISALVINISCKKDNATEGNEITGTADGKGIDYLPLADNVVVKARASLQKVTYDTLKNITGTASFNQDVQGLAGSLTVVYGYSLRQLFALDTKGSTLDGKGRKAYISTDGNAVLAYRGYVSKNDEATILPAQIKIGTQWIVNPQEKASVLMVVTDYYSTYTNSLGNKYSNVIKITATRAVENIDPYYYHSESIKGDIYLARGVGFVEAKITKYETADYIADIVYEFWGQTIRIEGIPYSRTAITGTLSRIN